VIPVFRPYYDEREEQAVVQVLRSGWIGLGPVTEQFERAFAARVGARYAIALNSCTAALHIALKLLDVGRGDEILVPTMTFVSTAMAADYEGASAVFCDVSEDALAMNYVDAAERRTIRTKAVVPVLYAGRPVRDPQLGLPVVYDCAHATGARWNAAGKICCWSFHAVKNLATGDGGMITLDDEDLYQRAVRLRWLGIDKSTWSRSDVEKRYWWEYHIDEVGFKYHMNDIAAAIGLVQLAKLDEMQERRRRLVAQYFDELAAVPDLRLPERDDDSSWHLFAIRTPHRNVLSTFLQAEGVSTGVHYKPVHLYPLYRKYSLPVAERVWQELLTLPLFPALTSEQVSSICDLIKRGLRQAAAVRA
jgi:dTDP-4-amino-4,6-dideoxygalactose transaminase